MSVALPNPVRLDPWQLIRSFHWGGKVPALYWVATQLFGPAGPDEDFTAVVTIPTDTHDGDNVALAQTPVAPSGQPASFTLDGSVVTSGVARFAVATPITVTTTADETGKSIAIEGVQADGQVTRIELPLPNAGQVTTPVDLVSVTKVEMTASAAGSITVGGAGKSQRGDMLIIALANYGGGAPPPKSAIDSAGNSYFVARENLSGLAILRAGNAAPLKGGDTITMVFPGAELGGGAPTQSGILLLARAVNVSSYEPAANGADPWEITTTRKNDVILGAVQIDPVGAYPDGLTYNTSAPDLSGADGYSNLRAPGSNPHDFYAENGVGLLWRLSNEGTEAISFQPTSPTHNDPAQGTQIQPLAVLISHR